MIAITKSSLRVDNNHARFLEILPSIEHRAHVAFRNLSPEAREEAVQEVVACCYAAYSRLVELDKRNLVFPTPLANFAIRQYWQGRRTGCRTDASDVMSPCCQAPGRVKVESLHIKDDGESEYRAALIEDKRSGPAETAAARIDLAAWFQRLPTRSRQIALALARGETTKEVAWQFQVSTARISQLRRELQTSWERFQSPAVSTVAQATN